MIVGTSLMKCTLKENVNEGEKVPYVVFKHRDEVFGSTNLKTIHSISEPEYSVDSSRIYSEIEIGYEKQVMILETMAMMSSISAPPIQQV